MKGLSASWLETGEGPRRTAAGVEVEGSMDYCARSLLGYGLTPFGSDSEPRVGKLFFDVRVGEALWRMNQASDMSRRVS